MNTMSIVSRDDLEIGMDMVEALDEVAYYDALEAADVAGEPWFSFEEFKARIARHAFCSASTLPAPADTDDDSIPF